MSTVLNKKFWSAFVKNNWEKKPILVRNMVSPLQEIDSQKIFNWLVKHSDHCRKIKKAVGLKFYIDGESQYQNEVLQSLPLQKDKSLQGYHERMSQLFDDYCLVCDELIQVAGWRRTGLQEFMDTIYQKVGIPNRQAEVGLYLGNYKKTPFGVHVDGCGVFSFPVEGIKKFRLWTSEYVKKYPDLEMSFDYRKHLKNSSVMIAQKGDLAYWPSKSWHIAESNGTFSATWSVGVWIDQPYIEVLMEMLKPFLSQKLGALSQKKYIRYFRSQKKNAEIQFLPKLLQKSIQILSSVTHDELQILMVQHWLRLSSQGGFRSAIRPDQKLRLKPSDWVVAANIGKVDWTRTNKKIIYVGINGAIFNLPNTRSAIQFLQRINSTTAAQVKSLLAAGKVSKEYFKILQALYQTGQLLKVRAPLKRDIKKDIF